MVAIAEMNTTLKLFMRAYRWRQLGEITPAHRVKPMSDCRVALVSSAGMVAPGQAPFDKKIGVPRALDIPWRLGFTMGEPDDAALQRAVLSQALALTDRDDIPVLGSFVSVS
ncbi:MAG: hypothetical protein V2I67_08935 [Thermoanaerobaculales bacterium]|jgi:hypothetical protein|nr:hypothetical protein [Thermoanaerobaculales bacterium]